MNVRLAGLNVGQWRELTAEEMTALETMLLTSSKTEEASKLSGALFTQLPDED
jgi:23S rRNA pseudouridine2604 synthase